jgi:hypothetical protein
MIDIMQRAMRAFYRTDYAAMNQPSSSDSCMEHHQGRDYAVLRNCCGTLAVYRVLSSGKLKGLDRWPSALN